MTKTLFERMTEAQRQGPDPHPSSDVLERLREPYTQSQSRRPDLELEAAATIERLSAQLEQAARVDEATIAAIADVLARLPVRDFEGVSNGVHDLDILRRREAARAVLSVLPVIGG